MDETKNNAGASAAASDKPKKTRKPPTRKSPMVLLRQAIVAGDADGSSGSGWVEVANVKSLKDGIAKAKAGGDGSYAVATLRRSFTVATVSQQVVK